MIKKHDFSGVWTLRHVYPGYLDQVEETGAYKVKARQSRGEIVFESMPEGKDNYMFVRLKTDGMLATGTWHEKAQSQGPYEGMLYSGAGQLLVGEDGKSMKGLWAGMGLDRKTNKPKIYTGRWEFTKD